MQRGRLAELLQGFPTHPESLQSDHPGGSYGVSKGCTHTSTYAYDLGEML